MTKEEFNLSEKGKPRYYKDERILVYVDKDVKEFIRRLKEEIDDNLEFCNRDGSNKKDPYTIYRKLIKLIDKLAGEQLIK